MQFQVPQFIETEDKIIGPFSLRQFLIVAAAGFASALLYFILATWLFALFAIILVGGAVAVSFIRIGGRPLTKVLTSAASFYWKPQTYVWKPEHAPVKMPTPSVEPGPSTLEKILTASPLHKSWENLQTGGAPGGKESDRQFIEQKMNERYQIFSKVGGDRSAARRVDYR